MMPSAEFMLGYLVTLLVAIVSLYKWFKWHRIAIQQSNRADIAETWMFENSDPFEGHDTESLDLEPVGYDAEGHPLWGGRS